MGTPSMVVPVGSTTMIDTDLSMTTREVRAATTPTTDTTMTKEILAAMDTTGVVRITIEIDTNLATAATGVIECDLTGQALARNVFLPPPASFPSTFV